MNTFDRLNTIAEHFPYLDEADLLWLVRRIREREIPLAWERQTQAEIASELASITDPEGGDK